MVIVVALARVIWRRTTPLPDWCPDLTPAERAIAHRVESLLYILMFVLPVTGYLFVMCGGCILHRALLNHHHTSLS